MNRFPKSALLAVAVSACIAACGGSSGGNGGRNVPSGGGQPPPTSSCTTPTAAGSVFNQSTESVGLCYELNEVVTARDMHVMGGGLAMSDIDKDGLLDLYVVHGMNERGKLYLNDGSAFVEAPGNRGISPRGLDNAGYFIDLDSDGWDDFVSIQYEANYVEVFKNDQTGNFVEATASTGIYLRKPTYSMAAADYDLDGDIDLFFAHWGWIWSDTSPVTEYLWENDGSGFFTDVSNIVEIMPSFRAPPLDDVLAEHSFTPIFADINSDRYPDILLAGDFESSQVLINNAGASFTDATTEVISDENGMGAAVADYDNDGDLDWFVSSIYHTEKEKNYQGGESGNRLYQNDGNGNFSDVTDAARVRDGDWGWGSCFADFDNDGNSDIFHTNGMRSVDSIENNDSDPLFVFFNDPSRLFMSLGDGTFSEQAAASGINHDDQGRGVICTDYDNDGRVDVLIATNGKSPTIYRNEAINNNHYLQIDLVGSPGNRQGIGSRVTVETASGTQMQEITLGSNYLAQQPCTLHFGLGAETTVTAITVAWSDLAGTVTRIENIDSDQRITISIQQ